VEDRTAIPVSYHTGLPVASIVVPLLGLVNPFSLFRLRLPYTRSSGMPGRHSLDGNLMLNQLVRHSLLKQYRSNTPHHNHGRKWGGVLLPYYCCALSYCCRGGNLE